jgi:hypothetical protein
MSYFPLLSFLLSLLLSLSLSLSLYLSIYLSIYLSLSLRAFGSAQPSAMVPPRRQARLKVESAGISSSAEPRPPLQHGRRSKPLDLVPWSEAIKVSLIEHAGTSHPSCTISPRCTRLAGARRRGGMRGGAVPTARAHHGDGWHCAPTMGSHPHRAGCKWGCEILAAVAGATPCVGVGAPKMMTRAMDPDGRCRISTTGTGASPCAGGGSAQMATAYHMRPAP